MKLKCLILAFCLLFFNAVYSQTTQEIYTQSYFEIYFHFGDENPEGIGNYRALYILNDDGTGKMRINYKGSKAEDSFNIKGDLFRGFPNNDSGKTDYSRMYYTCTNFYETGADSIKILIPAVTFWFKYNDSSKEFDPHAVVSEDDSGKAIQGKIDRKIKLLEEKDLTEELVLTFFSKNEDIYKNLFKSNIRAIPTELKTSRLFLLTVADTEDESIGPDCDMDRKKQQAYFKKIAEKLGIEIIISELTGKDISKTSLLSKIDSIQPIKSDIVIFYYSGHGYSKDDNRQYPYLDLRYDKDIPVRPENELNMEEIYSMVKNKPGRLNLVISDCCNWHLDVSNIKSANIASPRPSSVGLSLENMKTLFMSPDRTSILIAAAEKGQVSAGNPVNGGIFTSQFRESMQKYLSINYQNITWNQIIENTKTQTETVAAYSLCPKPENPEIINKCKQTPIVKVN